MLFNLFGKKNSTPTVTFKDKTYAHTTGKMKACVELAKQNEQVVFIAWFSDTFRQFRDYFAAHGVAEDRIKEYRSISQAQLQHHIPVFVEHYPLHEKEIEFTASWAIKDITVYNALDEAFFEPFGGEKIIGLMEKLGLQEDEAVEHSMISKSIINAQKKIAEKVKFEQSAHSQKEWMAINL